MRELVDMLLNDSSMWVQPWRPRAQFNPVSRLRYRGANNVRLMFLSQKLYGGDPRWITYRQAQSQEWQVRRGSKGTIVEYWRLSTGQDAHRERHDVDEHGFTLEGASRGYGAGDRVGERLERPQVVRFPIFNAAQIDGIPELGLTPFTWEPNERAERVVRSLGVPIYYDQDDRAFYSPSSDEIHMPVMAAFPSEAGFHSTRFHEVTHATGHDKRLKREDVGKGLAWESRERAQEELTAEFGALLLAAETGVPYEASQHAAYIRSWAKGLADDKHLFFRAAAAAQRAVEFVLKLEIQPPALRSGAASQLSM